MPWNAAKPEDPMGEATKGSNQIPPTEHKGNNSDTQQRQLVPFHPARFKARAKCQFSIRLWSVCADSMAFLVSYVARDEVPDQMGLYRRVVTYFFL